MATTCCVVGGGPAGMVLGLLLARCGVEVTVLEKHADFLRDFRGDTVHASTLGLLDELGLGREFTDLPARYMTSLDFALDSGTVAFADLSLLPGRHPHLAMVPQWDLLDLLARAARAEPAFTLLTEAEVTGLQREGSRVTGVTYVRHGSTQVLDADLVVACDGRRSTVRRAAGLAYRRFGVPMDVLWFRVPRIEGDPEGWFLRLGRRAVIALIDRGDYFQVGYVIRKGSYARLRDQGLPAFRERLVGAVPWMGERADELGSWDDLSLLEVELGRLRRWAGDGVLCIGDAAHVMSPVGGIGINLAVQDAVAAARLLAPALRRGRPTPAELHAVQRRRQWPTVLTQAAQRVAHRVLLTRAVGDRRSGRPQRRGLPYARLALLGRLPVLQAASARFVSLGVRPEHPPEAARRASAVVGSVPNV